MWKKIALSLFTLALLVACGPRGGKTPTTPPAAQIDQEEQAVYAALFKDMFPSAPSIVLMDMTATDPGGVANTTSQVEYIMKNLRDADPSVAESFKARNDQAYPLSPEMKVGIQYILLTQSQRNEIFSQNQDGWDAFYKNYPDAPGLTGISRVGFNEKFDQALVYIGTQSHYLAGAGYYVLLVKTNGAWAVSQKVMSWIS